MKAISEIATNVLADIRGRAGVRFVLSDVVRAINEAMLLISTSLAETKEDLMVDIENSGVPSLVTIPAAAADGASRYQKPSYYGRLRKIEVLIGTQWLPIKEVKSGEWQAGEFTGVASSGLSDTMTYENIGSYVVFRPGPIAQVSNGARISKEVEIPPLFMGSVVPVSANRWTLSADLDEVAGTLPASTDNSAYLGFSAKIYAGTGKGQTGKVSAYTALTRDLVFTNSFSPAADTTSKFSFMTPYTDILSGLDTLVQLRACITMLSTQRGEDISGYVARYNEMEEAMITKLGRLSPGPGRILPADMQDEWLYA